MPFPSPVPEASSPPAVAFRNVTRRFGEALALDDVTFDIAPGAIFGIVGESGAGKSTLLRMMNALDHPTSGTVSVAGTDLATLAKREINRLRHRIGVIFQSFNLVGNLTVRANIALPLRLQRQRDPARVADMADFVGLGGKLDAHPAELSGGQQQRVAVARALLMRPAVIVADEPTGNLDSQASAEVLSMLREAVDKLGQSVIMVTHDENSALIADRVLAVRDGKISASLDHPTADQLREI